MRNRNRRRWALTRGQAELLEEAGEILLYLLHVSAAILITGIIVEAFMQAPV